jgi:preprotein translocase subunit SecE
MALLRYKPGQGYYTRTLSFVWFLTLALALGAFVANQLSLIKTNTLYWQGGAMLAVALIAMPLLWWLINKPRQADFMIATEQEMRKVNWPSKKEIAGSTAVVILGTLFIAALLFFVDLCFGSFFQFIGILHAGSSGS